MLILQASYVLVTLLIIANDVALRYCLRETLWFQHLWKPEQAKTDPEAPLPVGSRVPTYMARLLGTDEMFTSDTLCGQTSMLIFVSPNDGEDAQHKGLLISLHSLSHRVQGRLYMICAGNECACEQYTRQLVDSVRRAGHELPVVIDEELELSSKLTVTTQMPCAVLLNEQAQIEKYGRQFVN